MNLHSASSNVSRETLDRLHAYADLVRRWNPRINLVAASTLSDLWERHVVDSMQVFDHADRTATTWADLGSGGGLPGIVCAILALELMPDCSFTLVESDKRKAAFFACVQTGIRPEPDRAHRTRGTACPAFCSDCKRPRAGAVAAAFTSCGPPHCPGRVRFVAKRQKPRGRA